MTNIMTRGALAGKAVRRERPVRPGLVLAVVLIGQFMAVLDASIVNVAAPSIHAHLHTSGAGLQLVVAGYNYLAQHQFRRDLVPDLELDELSQPQLDVHAERFGSALVE